MYRRVIDFFFFIPRPYPYLYNVFDKATVTTSGESIKDGFILCHGCLKRSWFEELQSIKLKK